MPARGALCTVHLRLCLCAPRECLCGLAVGFMVFNSFGKGVEYNNEGTDFVNIILQTARTLTERWNPVVGMLR